VDSELFLTGVHEGRLGLEFSVPDQERRRYRRLCARVPVEILRDGCSVAARACTQDVSMGGCYVETMFTEEVGTTVHLRLWLGDKSVEATAVVTTRHLQVGNGFQFVRVPPADALVLSSFLSSLEIPSGVQQDNP
jgi:hypothetical protein